MSRIRKLLVMPEVFTRELPPNHSLIQKCSRECHGSVLKLKFSPEIAYRLYDEFQEEQVVAGEDGNYYVTVPYELNHWTFHYLLSFGTYVEIMEPEEARRMFREKAADIVKKYI